MIADKVLRDTPPATQSGYSKLTVCPMQTLQTANTTDKPVTQCKNAAAEWLHLNETQAFLGRDFTLHAAAVDIGINAMCAELCSPKNRFLIKTHTCYIWINAPFSNALSSLQHHLICNKVAPADTAACVLIPGHLLMPLRSLLTGMRLLTHYTKGS